MPIDVMRDLGLSMTGLECSSTARCAWPDILEATARRAAVPVVSDSLR